MSTSCLQDFSATAGELTKEKFLSIPPQQAVNIVQKLLELTEKLRKLKQSVAKLSPEDLVYLNRNIPLSVNDPQQVAAEGAWRASILIKMTQLSSAELDQLVPKELELLPIEEHLGTAFFVLLADDRVKLDGPGVKGFQYLVTNRHVVQPGIDVGKPCTIVNSTILLNRNPDKAHPSTYTEIIQFGRKVPWALPDDESVDLAALAALPPHETYDYVAIPSTAFITDEEVRSKKVVEGDPVMFAGLFIQSFQEIHTLEPIVRSGTLAMLPLGKLETTMARRPGSIYLADAHVFGGNSGSPMFVDLARFAGGIGYNFKFLGVICGEMFENSDLTFNVTTTLTANTAANSDVSIVVPARDLLSLLNKKELQSMRDAAIEQQSKVAAPAQSSAKH
jgi:hypothetical protein